MKRGTKIALGVGGAAAVLLAVSVAKARASALPDNWSRSKQLAADAIARARGATSVTLKPWEPQTFHFAGAKPSRPSGPCAPAGTTKDAETKLLGRALPAALWDTWFSSAGCTYYKPTEAEIKALGLMSAAAFAVSGGAQNLFSQGWLDVYFNKPLGLHLRSAI